MAVSHSFRSVRGNCRQVRLQLVGGGHQGIRQAADLAGSADLILAAGTQVLFGTGPAAQVPGKGGDGG